MCGRKVASEDAVVRWHFDRQKKSVETLQLCHRAPPCGEKLDLFNRSLEASFVFKNMPEFLSYITRYETDRKKLRIFVQTMEKDRSYIRRFNPDKKKVKKLIILLDGVGE